MARTENTASAAATAAKPARKAQKASDRKLYVVLKEGVDAAQFRDMIDTLTFNGQIVLENMSAGNPKPFVILKLAASTRGQGGETASVETAEAPTV